MDELLNGALIDTRNETEKAKDFKFSELVTAAFPVVWKEKKESEWRKFPIYDQDSSGSCVAQTMAKLLGIIYWVANGMYVHFSATHIYQRRSNKPNGGMSSDDVFKIASEGVTLEELVPSQKMNDKQIDAVVIPEYKKKVGEIFKITKNWVKVPAKDIDTVASIIQTTSKGVMVWFFFKHDEWDKDPSVKYPDLDLNGTGTSRHSVCAVDYTLYNGKKALIIEDSWGPKAGTAGQRVIDEDFFKARNWYVAYPLNFKFEEVDKPNYFFTETLKFSSVANYDYEVVMLQKCLQYEGLFPTNADATGYFGAVTKKAVQEFQTRYALIADGIVGSKTRSKLNELFN